MSRAAGLYARFLVVIALCILSAPAHACDELPVGSSFWVRLRTPVSSFTAKRGMLVRGFLLESPQCDGAPILPTRIPIEGRVLSVHRVGLGLWHETAALEIVFLQIVPAETAPIAINARVKVVDNARESVRNGIIHGIRSTDTPQGMISSRLKYLPSLHLYPDPYLLGFKMLFPIFPEPEINLQAGTDIKVELAESAKLPGDLSPVPRLPVIEDDAELDRDLADLPPRTLTKKGKEADVVNILFTGSRDDLEEAFTVAGWHQSKPPSTHAVMRQFYSYLSRSSYATAPMTTQFLEGRKPDITLEKVFQSHEKRNHLRIWSLEETWEGSPLWASAAVRETGATLSIRHKGFIHHVSEDLDDEQQTIVRDLAVAGCVESVGTIARPDVDHILRNATGEYFRTNGSLEIIRVKPCSIETSEIAEGAPVKTGSRPYRYLRKEILTVRSDLLRANCIYALFDLTRTAIGAVRQNYSHRVVAAEFRQEGAVTPGK